jgi:hypothetical protein
LHVPVWKAGIVVNPEQEAIGVIGISARFSFKEKRVDTCDGGEIPGDCRCG